MPKLRPSGPRKRQFTEQDPIEIESSSHPPSKRQKADHPACEAPFRQPAAFWDNLSKISLTKRALRELDRRNAQSTPGPQSTLRTLHGPLTRHARAEFKRRCWHTKPASEFLRDCPVNCLKDVKRLATHGGPDLLYLRGVWFRYPLFV
jgi:hypothetical protein